ncbi:hypothetical protein FS837_003653 [Tulasnella sp. UAMH 9824]|nr:hypothetical protein FS837_003653 [Tulasnella sp. UAMH 9824]
MIKDLIEERRQQAKARKWKTYPQYWNGTIITGRLTEAEQAAQGQGRFSTSKKPGELAPFLPPEIVREIICHATDTFPAPCSIHRPSPSSSQNPISPSSQPPFPYSSWDFREDTDTDRKLHNRSMQVKLSVSRVSRMWRDVAAEFLFNSIRIQNSKQVPLLWRAFEGDAKRRGETASKDTMAQPGAAPWWIREVWVDLDKFQHVVQPESEEPLPTFDLSDLLKICPNIVAYRGFGRWREFQFQALLKEGAVLKRILDLPAEEGTEAPEQVQEAQDSQLVVPDTGRRIELNLIYDYEPFLPLFHDRTVSIATPLIVTLPSIVSMELRSLLLPRFTHQLDYVTIRLPNLTHLTLWGIDSLKYAAVKLHLPALRSVTYGRGDTRPLGNDEEPHLERFLERHGLSLEELTVLDKPCGKNFRRLDQFCPILETLRTPYEELPRSAVSSIKTVGLYGLEHAYHDTGPSPAFGEILVNQILKDFPQVTTIQDMSWRSGVIRRRAFTNWKDPEGAKYREVWTRLLRAVRTGVEQLNSAGSGTEFTGRKVTLLDWKGRVVDAVPTSPPGEKAQALSPDDQLMEALVSRTRL